MDTKITSAEITVKGRKIFYKITSFPEIANTNSQFKVVSIDHATNAATIRTRSRNDFQLFFSELIRCGLIKVVA